MKGTYIYGADERSWLRSKASMVSDCVFYVRDKRNWLGACFRGAGKNGVGDMLASCQTRVLRPMNVSVWEGTVETVLQVGYVGDARRT